MRQNIGGLAGLLAVIGLLIHTQAPPAAEKAGRNETSGAATKSDPDAQAKETEQAEGPWIAIQDFFSPRPNHYDRAGLTQPRLTDADSAELQLFLGLPTKRVDMWSIVATVADPERTRLSLFLDNQLESIERTFQAAGWDFAGQWLPWMDEVDSTQKDINERRKQRRLEREQEDYPGVLIFRSAPEKDRFPARALFVLLVPETPTTGISGPSFRAAMNIANAIRHASTGAHEIGLLAPSFTGSFSSLTDLVTEWEGSNQGGVSLNVYGGSISGGAYAQAFELATGHKFYSGIVDAEGDRDAFRAVLRRYGIEPEQAAYLRENATGLSRGFTSRRVDLQGKGISQDEEIPVYVFPRDIAHLRNAYQDVRSSATQINPNRAPGIDFSIKDPEGGEDSIPIFSTIQTPLSQNSIVDSITTELRRNHTRIVFIVATNTLDALFLTQLVRRNSPETRVLVRNPNVLFVAAAAREGLTGTLFLSTYPMFLKGTLWLDPRNEDRLRFPGPEFEGMFNVGQLLANDLKANFADPGHPPLHGYRHLTSGAAYPALWLLTLSRTGFLPLDLPDPGKGQGLFMVSPIEDACMERTVPDDPPPSSWFMTSLLATAAIVVWCGLVLACNDFKGLKRPRWLVITDQFPTRLMALFGASLALSALIWVLAFPVWRAIAVGSSLPSTVFAGFITFLFGFCTPPACVIRVWFKSRGPMAAERAAQDPAQRWRLQASIYAGTVVVLFLVVIIAWGWSSAPSSNAAFFFRFRALDLYSGASPAAPFALLTIAFFGISLVYFKRYTDAGKIRPLFPPARKAAWHELHQANWLADRIENAIMAPAQLPLRQWQIRLAVCGFFVLICALALAFGNRIGAFEIWHYNWALLTALVVLLFCLATGCHDLMQIWTNLSRLIDRIDLLSLDAALDRVSADWAPQPVWAFGRSVSREALTRQMLDELRMREEALRAQERRPYRLSLRKSGAMVSLTSAKAAASQRKWLAARALARLDGGLLDHLTYRQDFEKFSAWLAGNILVRDLHPDWEGKLDTMPEDVKKEFADFLDHSRGFVMLQLTRFLIYVVQQVRRIALCVSLDVLMLILFFHSYSSQSPTLISQFLAVLFVAVGVILFQVFAGMERNRTLSRISRTNPGELGPGFWLHLAALGGLPFLGLLAHLFPPISNFLFSWVAPNLQSTT
jgi:hypothetical protein